MIIQIKKSGLLLILAYCLSCSQQTEPNSDSENIEAARKTQDAYRNAWLAGDSSKVLNTLSKDIMLFPPGKTSKAIKGKDAVSSFWFPVTGDTIYPIKEYKITNQEVFGENEYIFFTGRSFLIFETKIKGVVQKTDTSNSEFISVYRKDDGEWHIFRQMWNIK